MSSVHKTIQILELICSEKSGVTVSQLASLTGESRPNVCYYLKMLEKTRYIYKDSHSGRYKASYRIVDLASRVLSNNELYEIAYPILLRFSEEAQLTVHMAVKEGDMGVCILKVGSSKTMPSISRIGEAFDLYPTALGKVILAWLPEAELDDYIRRIDLKPYTPYTVTDPEKLRNQLKEIRSRGYSIDQHEHRVGVRGLGVPVFDYTNKIVAAISVLLLPSHTEEDIREIALKLQIVADEISQKLGYRAKPISES